MPETQTFVWAFIMAVVLLTVALVQERIRNRNRFYRYWARRWGISDYYVRKAINDFDLVITKRHLSWTKRDFFRWYNTRASRSSEEASSFYVDEIFADQEEIFWSED